MSRRAGRAALYFGLWLLSGGAVASTSTPLLDYARTLSFDTLPGEQSDRRELARATYAIAHDPPPSEDCARTLGARRFAGLLDELGAARAALGDPEGAVQAYQAALACSPRTLYLHAALAEELMHAGRYTEALATASRGLAIDRNDYRLGNIIARLYFIEERWSDAIAWLRWSAAAAPGPEPAMYWECFLWVAQRRAGTARPQLTGRMLTDSWPRPVLETLQGKLAEDGLLEEVRKEPSAHRRREILVEALYYVGELRLADADTDGARRYFAAAVNLKVLYFVEHHMALAELAKLRR
ncbi:MAG TPA: tetratricopeptide repeat protein [Steroidobacteraceae bacterium]|nr:tetratricopeptide repeat protein [Steroidobacteraceae bacterium]